MRRVTVGDRTIESCARCAAKVREPTPGAAVPAGERWGATLLRPFSVEALLTALAIAVPAWLSWIPGIGRALALLTFAATVSYYFQIIDHVGRGRPGMPEPSGGVESWSDVVSLTWRGVLCIFVGFAPFLYWYWFDARLSPGAPNPLTGLSLLLAGQTYMPAAILCVVLTDSNVGAVWPPAWIQIVARAPLSYLALVGLYLASIIAGFYLRLLFVLGGMAIPVVGSLLVGAAGNVLLFMQAAVVGGFLRRNAEHFGYD
ncbi:MAG TPA: hypothetical protein VFF06_07685 [Polyangia bacterium]|nr:hypothetical protein [Polyangia bacterium]